MYPKGYRPPLSLQERKVVLRLLNRHEDIYLDIERKIRDIYPKYYFRDKDLSKFEGSLRSYASAIYYRHYNDSSLEIMVENIITVVGLEDRREEVKRLVLLHVIGRWSTVEKFIKKIVYEGSNQK